MTQNVSSLTDRVIAFGTFRLSLTQRVLFEGNRQVHLGSRAMGILFALIDQPGEVVTKARLMQRVWPEAVVEEGTLRVHIASLRKVLGEGHSGTRYVENVTGQGYRFVAPVTVADGSSGGEVFGCANGVDQLSPALHRMIGRTEVVAALVAQVPKRRFVTIVGAGGIGKTTVALATAVRLRSVHPQGVCCVDLAAVADPMRVASAVASIFRLPVFSEDPLPNLVEFLASKQLLILLDNCEHVVESAARVAEAILRRCPGVHLLATSREPLRAEGEWVHRLPPLELPTRDDLRTTEALGYAAIQLFVERATASTGSFELHDDDVAQVAEICRKLDGLPLAIELAAACVDRFGLRGLAARIDDRLQVLKTGRRTALPRHRTLRATLDWSYDILSVEEQRLLRRLAVFAGNFGGKSAMAVAASADLDAPNIGDHLADLAGKSLLVANVEGDDVQYRLLDTTRAYALEKLQESGEGNAVRRRHAQLCASWVRTANLEGSRSQALEKDIADVRAALDWCFSPDGDTCLGVRLIAQSAILWFRLSFLDEYGRRVERALKVLGVTTTHDREVEMELNVILGELLLYTEGPGPRAVAALSAAYESAKRTQNASTARRCLWGLHSDRIGAGDYAAALDYARRWCRSLEDSGSNTSRDSLGDRMLALAYHLTGDQPQARAHAESVLRWPMDVSRTQTSTIQYDDRVGALVALARALWVQGFPEQAQRAGRDAIELARTLDHGLSLCHALACAGIVELWIGNPDLAREIAGELCELAARHSLSYWQYWGRCIQWALAGKQHGFEDMLREARANPFHSDLHEETLATFDDSLASARAIERAQQGLAGWCAPELLRVKAIGLQRQGGADSVAATALFEAALDLSRRQGALAWELRAATSLAKSWALLERKTEARELLQGVIDRFTEGETTADYVAAQAVLKGLWAARTIGRRA
jgi:predicted ATPase/DNA-binding winged helix-turn-helix (wHTH) protein